MTISRTACLLIVVAVAACSGGDAPKRAENGAPVTLEFVGLTGPEHRLKAKVRYVSSSDKEIKSVRTVLHYVDEGGKELKHSPWADTDDGLIAPNQQATSTVGTFVPPETRDVRAEVTFVAFADGTHWSAPRRSRKAP